jgi:hypothetical protein
VNFNFWNLIIKIVDPTFLNIAMPVDGSHVPGLLGNEIVKYKQTLLPYPVPVYREKPHTEHKTYKQKCIQDYFGH